MPPFFHKAPELIQLNRLEMQVNHQVAGDSFDVLGCFVQPTGDRVLVDVFDPSRCPNAIPFSQARDHVAKGLFIRFQTKQGRATTRRKCPLTDFAS